MPLNSTRVIAKHIDLNFRLQLIAIKYMICNLYSELEKLLYKHDTLEPDTFSEQQEDFSQKKPRKNV